MNNKTITIATRESALAMWQSEYVAAQIEANTPYQTQLLPMTTEGDQRLEVTLNKIGGKEVHEIRTVAFQNFHTRFQDK